MASEWNNSTLDQLGRIVTGKTPSSSSPDYYGGEIPFITPTDFDGRRLIERTVRCLTVQGAETVRSSRIPPGSVMVSCIGSDMGKAAMNVVESVTNQQINSIIVEPGNSALFVYYNLSRRQDEIRTIASGSAQPILNKTAFGKLDILLPPLQEQNAIACLLGTLDDKIELNRRMIGTLEGLVRALFKSWFVDFDPVRAKAEGSEPVLPKAVADLFSDQFQESEIGKIPCGWSVSNIGTIADVIDCLHSKKPGRRPSGMPLLQLWNIRDDALMDMADTYWISEEDYQKWISRIEASAGDCVITNVGRVGAVAQMPVGLKAALGRNMTAVRCRATHPFPTFLLQALTSDAMRGEIELRKDSGTILDALNVRNIPKLRIPYPDPKLLVEFEKISRPVRAKMEANQNQSATVAGLRDALLPKLISGELRIPDAERIVGGQV